MIGVKPVNVIPTLHIILNDIFSATCIFFLFQKYGNCSCISSTTTEDHAYLGKCGASCVFLPLFLPVFAIVMFLTFVSSMPALTATLR